MIPRPTLRGSLHGLLPTFVRGAGSVGIPDMMRCRLRRALSPGPWRSWSAVSFSVVESSRIFFCRRLDLLSKPDHSRRLGFGILLFVLLVCFVQIKAGEAEVSTRHWLLVSTSSRTSRSEGTYVDHDACRQKSPAGSLAKTTVHRAGPRCRTWTTESTARMQF